MTMFNCIIVDDEQHAIDLLKLHVEQTRFLNLVHATTSPVDAMEFISREKVDLIFLDVQMPQVSGIEFLDFLKGRYRVILTTAYSDYALQGFENGVVDYLLKPITFPRFLQASQRLLSIPNVSAAAEDDYLLVKTEVKGKLIKINILDIIYVEGLKQYVSIYTRQGKRHVALLNIKDLEFRLRGSGFLRIHKSFIVSMRDIVMVQGNMIYLENISTAIPVGDTYKDSFNVFLKCKIIS